MDDLARSPTLLESGPGQTLLVPVTYDDAAVDPDVSPIEDRGFHERYLELALLGSGGMGEVHLCKDTRIGRDVAIKRAHAGDDTLVGATRAGAGSSIRSTHERFVREARVQGQLEHPSVVPVYDLGLTPEGAPFFTMKRVRGLSLEQILGGLRRGDDAVGARYPRRKLLSAFSSACLAVDFAHARGVLHRDLKPANLMLGDFGEVYVLDWGLAKVVGHSDEANAEEEASWEDSPTAVGSPLSLATGAPQAGLTDGVSLMGTPGYLSPEQASGRTLDARSDVYGLGAILFELLTLQPLHAPGSPTQLLASTLSGVEARPSVRVPDCDAPPEFDAICAAATSLEHDVRLPSARALHEAIERYLDGDRDLERRRALSREHADTAARAAERAVSIGADSSEAALARALALREAGRALALDPHSGDGLRVLLKLMTTPPVVLPPEAREELRRSAVEQHKRNARRGMWVYLSWFLAVPIHLWIGVRDARMFAIVSALFVVAAGVAWAVSRLERESRAAWIAFMLVSIIAITTLSRTVGPLIFLPTAAGLNLMAFTLSPSPSLRRTFFVLGAFALVLPLGLEWAGVLPHSYEYRDGVMVVLPQMVNLPPFKTEIFLACITITAMMNGAFFVWRARTDDATAQEKLILQAWHLKQCIAAEDALASTDAAGSQLRSGGRG